MRGSSSRNRRCLVLSCPVRCGDPSYCYRKNCNVIRVCMNLRLPTAHQTQAGGAGSVPVGRSRAPASSVHHQRSHRESGKELACGRNPSAISINSGVILLICDLCCCRRITATAVPVFDLVLALQPQHMLVRAAADYSGTPGCTYSTTVCSGPDI